MKITKSQLKKLLKEEIEEADPALLDAIKKLGARIEDLDVSIDYLASTFTGGYRHRLRQAASGPYTSYQEVPSSSTIEISELKQIIQEELEGCLEESDYLSNIYKWCPSGSKCAPQKQKTKWWKGR